MGIISDKSYNVGALVISLDFELHWGVFERSIDSYIENLIGARRAIPEILRLFDTYKIHATWATVGFLFAHNRAHLERFMPRIRPSYLNRRLNSYDVVIGEQENIDPIHYAGSLLDQIAIFEGQEIGSHTFSHFFCLEPGQTRLAFEADLDSAVAIASESGIILRSIVLPRNQFNEEYEDILVSKGFVCYRGTEDAWFHHAYQSRASTLCIRSLRFADYYLGFMGTRTTAWSEIIRPSGLCNIRSSRFLRPHNQVLSFLEPLRLKRILSEMGKAASQGRIFHLWWHPHNFGLNLEKNIKFLARILECYANLRDRFGMRSLTMFEAANLVKDMCSRNVIH